VETPTASIHSLGDVTFTRGSNIISTSVDYSGVISVDDYIGKPSAAGNGEEESYYRVLSVSPASIRFIVFMQEKPRQYLS
jgi:hypothetical protein